MKVDVKKPTKNTILKKTNHKTKFESFFATASSQVVGCDLETNASTKNNCNHYKKYKALLKKSSNSLQKF